MTIDTHHVYHTRDSGSRWLGSGHTTTRRCTSWNMDPYSNESGSLFKSIWIPIQMNPDPCSGVWVRAGAVPVILRQEDV